MHEMSRTIFDSSDSFDIASSNRGADVGYDSSHNNQIRERHYSSFTSCSAVNGTEAPRRRSSAFVEVGLGGDDSLVDAKLKTISRPRLQVRFRSKVDVLQSETEVVTSEPPPNNPPKQMSSYVRFLPRMLFLALTLAVLAPSFTSSPYLSAGVAPIGAKAGVIDPLKRQTETLPQPAKRANSPTDVCKRWALQSAIVNGTVYLYSGRSTTQADQTTNQWSTYTASLSFVLN